MGIFTDRVRHGTITGPRKQAFTLDQWKQAYEEIPSCDPEDQVLYSSAKHIHTKLAAIRKATEASSLSRLSMKTRVKALVSVANHQFEALELQLKSIVENIGPEGVKVCDLATMEVTLANGTRCAIDSALCSMLDGLTFPIKAALGGRTTTTVDSFDDVKWNDVGLEVQLGAFYDEAEKLWDDCVWNTYTLGGTGSLLIAFPLDPEARKGVLVAARRKVALNFEMTSYAHEVLSLGQIAGHRSRVRDVKSVVINGDQQQIEIGSGKLDPDRQAMLYAMQTMACPEYYDSLLREPQPKLHGGTLSQLFDGWMVVSRASQRVWDVISSAHRGEMQIDSDAVSDMRNYVPYFTIEALVTALREAADIPAGCAKAIVNFLTFHGKSTEEFWTQPLVSDGDSSIVYPIFGAIAAPPNLRYMLERWMNQLKVDLNKRGPAFESYLRANLVEAAKTSPMLSKIARVVPCDYTFKCADMSFGQMDILFCVGSQVFVVEAKCILEPTESTSIGTHRLAIERAVEQAKSRVSLIEGHREEFISDMKKFGWNLPPAFNVSPLVAVSTVAHVGVMSNDVPVVDELILGKFFAGGYEFVGLNMGDFSPAERTYHPFYACAEEAEAGAMGYFERPPQLQQYIENFKLRQMPIYAVSQGDWSGLMIAFE